MNCQDFELNIASLKSDKDGVNRIVMFLSILSLIGAAQAWKMRAVRQPAGVLVTDLPIQVDYPSNQPELTLHSSKLRPLASYKIKARILSAERYRFDATASLAPIDLCVGWGALSDTQNIAGLTITQGARWCSFRWNEQPPIAVSEISQNIANMHLIPAEPWVAKLLVQLRVGQLVELEGDLVEVQSPEGRKWKSSLTRTDTGDGACEVMYVKLIRLL